MDKSDKLAAKIAEKRAKPAKVDGRNSRFARVNSMSTKKDFQPMEWLDGFGEKTIESVYNFWAGANASKIYGHICRAVDKMKEHGGVEYKVDIQTDHAIGEKREYGRESRLLQELAQILDFDEKQWVVTRAGILHKAVEDWVEDLGSDTKRRKRKHEDDAVEKAQKWADDKWKDGDGKVVVHALCLVEPTLAFEGDEDSTNTPFGAAAENGATEIVKVMLEELVIHLQRNPEKFPDFQKALLEKINMKPKGSAGSSAFLAAAKNLRLGVLQLLLTKCPSLASMESLSATITQAGQGDIDKGKKDPALDAFKLILEHMTGLGDMMDIWKQAVRARSPKLVKYLIERESAHITYDQFALIVEEGTAQMWKLFGRVTQESFLKQDPGNLLHRAVQRRNEGLVESILKDFPREIEKKMVDLPKNKTGAQTQVSKYPMEYLGEVPLDMDTASQATYTRIRDLLLDAMIRSDSSTFGIGGIRLILNRSKGMYTTCLTSQRNARLTEVSHSRRWVKVLSEATELNPTY
jgi:hypothetical protein